MAMLIKLLATKIVANNFFGRSSKEATIPIAADFFSMPSSIFAFVSENKATSAPEIKAEHTSSTKSNTTLVINDVLETNKFENKTGGSGSKMQYYLIKTGGRHH